MLNKLLCLKISMMEAIKMWFTKKNFLTWSEYAKLVHETEMVNFISATTLESVNNFWKKEEVRR